MLSGKEQNMMKESVDLWVVGRAAYFNVAGAHSAEPEDRTAVITCHVPIVCFHSPIAPVSIESFIDEVLSQLEIYNSHTRLL